MIFFARIVSAIVLATALYGAGKGAYVLYLLSQGADVGFRDALSVLCMIGVGLIVLLSITGRFNMSVFLKGLWNGPPANSGN